MLGLGGSAVVHEKEEERTVSDGNEGNGVGPGSEAAAVTVEAEATPSTETAGAPSADTAGAPSADTAGSPLDDSSKEGTGEVELEVELEAEPGVGSGVKKKKSATLLLDKVGFEVGVKDKTKAILEDVTMSLTVGEMVACMGPSGAGKTTLANLISGVNAASSGGIALNKEACSRAALRSCVVFVPQDDLLLHTMTAAEAVMESVLLHDVAHEGVEAAKRKTEKLLKQFGLNTCRDVFIGSADTKKGLSGGQRKRLSIAVDMVGNPTFLLVDEPTSGLDSASSGKVVRLLKQMAAKQCGVFATIHAPSAALLSQFDKLCLLVKGRCAYFGPTSGVVSHFAAIGMECPQFTNPADFVMDLLSVDEEAEGDGEDDIQRIKKIVDHAKVAGGSGSGSGIGSGSGSGIGSDSGAVGDVCDVPPEARPASSASAYEEVAVQPKLPWTRQFRLLLKRNFRHQRREPALARARIVSHIVLGLFIGGIYWDLDNTPEANNDRITLILFCMIFTMLASAIPTILTFLDERAVFAKESRNGWYSTKAWYGAKLMADIPLQVIPVVIFFTLVFFMSGFVTGADRYGAIIGALLTHVLVVHGWATFVATIAPSLPVAIFLVPISFMPCLMGFFRPTETITWVFRWLVYINPFRYVWNCMSLGVFYDNEPILGNPTLEDRLLLDADFDDYWKYWGILLAFLVGIRILAYVALVKLHTQPR